MRGWLIHLLVAGALCSPAWAQQADEPQDQSDPYDQPTEYGIRFTPGMAQGIARLWTNEVLIKRYEIDEHKADEAVTAISRRLMKLAHTDVEAGQELAEYTMTTMFDMMSKTDQMGAGIPRELAQGVASRLLPFMPAVREMVDGVVQDVRPMLGLKGQLKLTGDLTMAKMAMEAFENNMHKWAKGEVDPFSDPFRNEAEEIKKDEDGQSRALKGALRMADSWAQRGPGAEWDQYVKDAKTYYSLDASQSASADSLLREYKQRALAEVGGEDAWRAKVYRNRLWWAMSNQLPGRWNSPIRTLLERDHGRILEPVEALGVELKDRIDTIPTQAQRNAAQDRVLAALAEKGLRPDASAGPADAPASATTQPGPASRVTAGEVAP